MLALTKKVSFGESLCVLGVDVCVPSFGYSFAPADSKVEKWLIDIQSILANGALLPGEACKLAGRLSWACTKAFRAFGRAMLRPIFDQQTRYDGKMSPELRRALSWWDGALQFGIAEVHPWVGDDSEPLHLFCDASGKAAKLGAVIRADGKWFYTSMTTPGILMRRFRHRRDKQILGLELLAISLGLGTFQWLLEGRRVVIHCDNSGAEVCFSFTAYLLALVLAVIPACVLARAAHEVSVRRGTSRAWDHAQLVHSQLMFALENRMELFVKRVSTSDNIADIPSREVCGAPTIRFPPRFISALTLGLPTAHE